LAGECGCVVACELLDTAWRRAGDLGDCWRYRCRFAAPVVRVVLEEAVDLPGRQQSPDAVSECFRRYVNEPDGPAESGAQRRGNLRVRDGFRPGQGVRAPSWPALVSATAATALRAVLIWSQLHGIVSLEIAGNFASMSIDADQLFEIQLTAITAMPG
jgi:hypothetical protein